MHGLLQVAFRKCAIGSTVVKLTARSQRPGCNSVIQRHQISAANVVENIAAGQKYED